MKKTLICLVFSLFFLLLASGIFIYIAVNSTCTNISLQANNKEKIQYLNRWISENIYKTEILSEFGYLSVVDNHRPNTSLKKLGFDYSILGFRRETARITIHRLAADHLDFMNPYSIKSIEFSDGRDSIFLKMKGSDSFGSRFASLPQRLLTEISDNVVVKCD